MKTVTITIIRRVVSCMTDLFIATVDEFIDVIMKDHRKYIKWLVVFPVVELVSCSSTNTDSRHSLYVYNKIDSVSLDFLDKLAREPNTCVMSCELDLGVQDVVDRSWTELQLMRIYTKRYVAVFGWSFIPHIPN
jgi:ribosome-interacting GTPase 1